MHAQEARARKICMAICIVLLSVAAAGCAKQNTRTSSSHFDYRLNDSTVERHTLVATDTLVNGQWTPHGLIHSIDTIHEQRDRLNK
jgi:hypothetical protein